MCGMVPCVLARAAARAANPTMDVASQAECDAVEAAYAAVEAARIRANPPLSREALRALLNAARGGRVVVADETTQGGGSHIAAVVSAEPMQGAPSVATAARACIVTTDAAAQWIGSAVGGSASALEPLVAPGDDAGGEGGDGLDGACAVEPEVRAASRLFERCTLPAPCCLRASKRSP